MDFKLVKLPSSTLVESLVSMTLISLSLGLAIIIFIQVSKPSSSIQKLSKAQQKCNEIFQAYRQNPKRNEELIEFESFNIEITKTILDKGIFRLELEAKQEIKDSAFYRRSQLIFDSNQK